MNIMNGSPQYSLLPKNRKLEFEDDDYVASFVRGEKQAIYISKVAVKCLGEYCIDVFLEYGLPSRTVFFLETGHQEFYGAAIEDGCVTVECTGERSIVESYLTAELEGFKFIVSNNVELINNAQFRERAFLWNSFSLDDVSNDYITSLSFSIARKKRRQNTKKLFVTFVFFLALFFSLRNMGIGVSEEPVVIRYIDPYETYIRDVESQMLASHVLKQATNLYAIMLTIPSGYTFTEIKNNGLSLAGLFTKTSGTDAKVSVLESWLTPSYKNNFNGESLFLDLNGSHGRWNEAVEIIDGVGSYTHDMLVDMGATNVVLSNIANVGKYSQQTLTFEFIDKPFGLMGLVADLLRDAPWFLNSITMTPSSEDGVLSNTKVELTLKGIQK